MPKRVAVALLIALLAVLGVACSDDDPAVDAGAGTAAADHNDADVTFAQQMIPHHEGALEMARLAPSNAADQRVKDLAARIEGAQDPEIKLMQGWLEDWDEPDVSGGAMGGMDHGGGESGSGMSEQDMGALEGASGAEFDKMFLTMMVEHHKGAIEMADTEIADGQFPAALDLARKIKGDQEKEIAEMEGLAAQLA